MLVLTRRVNETIVIEGGIRVTVVAIHGDKIRLGITAPASVRVDRHEVHERRAALTAEPMYVEGVLQSSKSCQAKHSTGFVAR